MKRNLVFYPHYVLADQHAKFKMLRVQFGWEGEGKFWALNNRIALSEECRLDISKKYNKAALANDLNFTLEEFDGFIIFLRDECELIKTCNNGNITTSILQEAFAKVMRERSEARARHRRTSGEKIEISGEKTEGSGESKKNGLGRKENTNKKQPKNNFSGENVDFSGEQTDKVKESKVNKRKEIYKEKYLDFVLLTTDEYQKLLGKFGQKKLNDWIERVNDYIGSKGTKYKSHYHTILTWSKKEVNDNKQSEINFAGMQ